MSPTRELLIKFLIAFVGLSAIGPAAYVLGKLVLLPVLGQTYAVLIISILCLAAWIYIVIWSKRQFDVWWKDVQ